RDKKLLLDFLPGNSRVKEVEDQIANYASQKKEMETNTPALLVVKVNTPEAKPADANPQPSLMQNNLMTEQAMAAGLEAKVNFLTNEFAEVQARFAAVDAGSSAINELERTRKIEEEYYNNYLETRESSR